MTQPPPTSPETQGEKPEQAQRSIQDQLDELLAKIEKAEPGTLDPQAMAGASADQTASGSEPAAIAGGLATAGDTNAGAVPAADAALEPGPEQAVTDEASGPDGASADAPPPPAEQTNMLASLEAALKELSPDTSDAPPPATGGTEPVQSGPPDTPAMTDTEAQLQDELNALLNAEPQAPPQGPQQPPPEPEPAPEPGQTDAPSDVEAQLQDEINALLGAEPAGQEDGPEGESEAPQSDEDRIAQEIDSLLTSNADPANEQQAATIDELDNLLAQEIDEDDELLGDFQSVQDVTAGIQVDEPQATAYDDNHAATARDVAAELDSQPELAPPPQSEFEGEDPFAVLSQISDTAEENEAAYQEEQAVIQAAERAEKSWPGRLKRAKDRLLRACFVVNWPARRYLSAEHRANLGYIAILNLFGAAAIWLYLIFL